MLGLCASRHRRITTSPHHDHHHHWNSWLVAIDSAIHCLARRQSHSIPHAHTHVIHDDLPGAHVVVTALRVRLEVQHASASGQKLVTTNSRLHPLTHSLTHTTHTTHTRSPRLPYKRLLLPRRETHLNIPPHRQRITDPSVQSCHA